MADPSAWPENVPPPPDAGVPAPPYRDRRGDGAPGSPYADADPSGDSISGLYTELYGAGQGEAPAGPPPAPPPPRRDSYAAAPGAGPPPRPRPGPPPPPDHGYGDYQSYQDFRGEPEDRGFRSEPGDRPWNYAGRSRRGMGRWVNGTTAAIAGGLALILVVVGVLMIARGSNPSSAQGRVPDRQVPAPPPEGDAPIPSDDPGDPKGPPVQIAGKSSPVRGRITDRTSGLSYARLGGVWNGANNSWMRDHGWPTGQDAIAMRNFEGNGDYKSGCYSGLLGKRISYAGPDSLQASTEAFANAVEQTDDVYPAQHARTDIESRAFDIGNRKGWLVRFQLSFPQAQDEGWTFAKENAAVVLIDRGRGRRPAILFMTLPTSHKTQGDMGVVLNSVRPA